MNPIQEDLETLAHDQWVQDLDDETIQDKLPYFQVDLGKEPLQKVCVKADELFKRYLSKSGKIGMKAPVANRKKMKYWRQLYFALVQTYRDRGCVLTPRRKGTNGFTKAQEEVIEAAKDMGLVREVRGKPFAPSVKKVSMSRLIPFSKLKPT